ncbi:pimeloyl-ACP methyl ester carboxylesterase [Deinobacterium chartae]|uniref:Pimeloyl-ACP methyl ester carboxylesterase n=1 Tax=Deinobacterium chartae TaxID=521158 RepID=A0A841I1L2_9DEIO|nr:alpha/beta hydrolase [Deinobacterium chartae]MBB6099701.1 pimeloyl-ACP methyl ester carboxylesterase [Deinobacterium chartae]
MVLGILGGLLGTVAFAAAGYSFRNTAYFGRDMAAVRRAGFVEKQLTVNGSVLNYAEGPNNGPPLLLIHGQSGDWKHYARVLPGLARSYRVLAVDCYGHGGSAWVPGKYSVAAMGADLARFMREVMARPALVSGHSSGGLLAAWLAANAPDTVRGVILEDPPLFTTLLPRAQKTWNYVDLATTSHNFLASGEKDFVSYCVAHGRLFALFRDLQPLLLRHVREQRAKYPDRPVRVFYMPPAMNELLRGLHRYDPRFGQAFYDGSWDAGSDHAEILVRIGVPTVLVHARWSYDDSGILMAAMDDRDAERARSLIQDVEFVRVNSGHGFHFEQPRAFLRVMKSVQERLQAERTNVQGAFGA